MLVLRGGAAGDFFLTLPALAALRRHWSNAFIEVVGHAGAASVAVAAGLIDRASALDAADTARLFAVGSELPEHQRSSIRGFDIIVSYLHDPDGVVAAKLKRQGVRRLVVGSPIVKDTHAAAHLVKPLAELGIERDPSPLRLTLKPAHLERGRRRAAGIGPRVLAVHPGSGSPKKNWPVAKFMDLAGRACGELGLMPMFTVAKRTRTWRLR